MDIRSDICIIGNGAIGKTAALGFAQAGLSVTLIDAKATTASASAGPTPGSVSASAERAWDLRVYALNPLAQELLQFVGYGTPTNQFTQHNKNPPATPMVAGGLCANKR